ncbi:MAG: Xaa-Pro peptidase family protein [Desulfobacterales bacterium]|nr:Xaa-Pro peptidase family protein [Desulfobacterales bacterium]MDD4071759.1 Xaa-Pro peptidase family protein [Desulfobacterales bacterium]MDD4391969.1 Xaa-Pro peptidase family protein [Desulfobacterales bacterium]
MTMVPFSELQCRWQSCRALLHEQFSDAGGILVFSRLNIYYLTGTFGNGLFWLPMEGSPVLLCRRGLERARLESPVETIVPFRSYREIIEILKNAGSPLAETVGVEMNALSWTLGMKLKEDLPDRHFVRADMVLSMTRSVKSAWELDKIRQAGAKHDKCLRQLLPELLSEGMTETQVAHAVWKVFFSEQHQGLLRMEKYGEEVFLGHISVGESANYPSVYNGPVGLRGVSPAVPHMGSQQISWEQGAPLVCDVGFMLDGYQTDKTQVYWLGREDSIPSMVRKAQDFCIDVQDWLARNLKPGAIPAELWEHCSAWAKKAGWSEGYMALGGNKVDFVGHGIGLAIDEFPVLAKGFDHPLKEGMVLALEPKIGIRGIGMAGVENTFEVTPEGGKSLTGEQYDIVCIPG